MLHVFRYASPPDTFDIAIATNMLVQFLLQFATHSYICSLGMKLCGLSSVDGVPAAFPTDSRHRAKFLRNLAARVVDFVFLKPKGVSATVRAGGDAARTPVPNYCICGEGGNFMLYTLQLLKYFGFSFLVFG